MRHDSDHSSYERRTTGRRDYHLPDAGAPNAHRVCRVIGCRDGLVERAQNVAPVAVGVERVTNVEGASAARRYRRSHPGGNREQTRARRDQRGRALGRPAESKQL